MANDRVGARTANTLIIGTRGVGDSTSGFNIHTLRMHAAKCGYESSVPYGDQDWNNH